MPVTCCSWSRAGTQVELVLVYGADPGSLDTQHKTPIDHARFL